MLPALLTAAIGPIWVQSEGYEMPVVIPASTASRPLMLAALLGGLLLAATLGLWAYYGTAVFFEMVRAGWVACF
jgi:hypothetical protein